MALFSSFTLFEGIALAIALQFLLLFWVLIKQAQQKKLTEQLGERIQQTLISQLHQLHIDLSQSYQTSQQFINEKIAQGQLTTQQLISDAIQRQMADVREQMTHSFKHHASSLTSHLQLLTEEIRNHLNTLTQQVNHKLTEGFEKTSSTFIDVVKRLTIIDEAQKKITELSSHVVSLQDVLEDKKARGAFGEVQSSTLISNMLPSASYQMQYTLSNQKR
ncbi:DNA recombination protein RmuC, partial [Salmonella enterica subsp. enterica serovar Agona]